MTPFRTQCQEHLLPLSPHDASTIIKPFVVLIFDIQLCLVDGKPSKTGTIFFTVISPKIKHRAWHIVGAQ